MFEETQTVKRINITPSSTKKSKVNKKKHENNSQQICDQTPKLILGESLNKMELIFDKSNLNGINLW